MLKLEIHRMLVICTGHISDETRQKLEAEKHQIIWGPSFTRETGWIFWTGMLTNAFQLEYMPPDLRGVLLFARERGCEWVMLDADGERLETLPWWDW